MINKDKVSNNNEDKGDIKIKYRYINKNFTKRIILYDNITNFILKEIFYYQFIFS